MFTRREASPYQRGQRFILAVILATPAIMWSVPFAVTAMGFSTEVAIIAVLPLAFVWFAVGSLGSFMIACPNCGRSVFLRRFMISAPWPARKCSKCGNDLTAA